MEDLKRVIWSPVVVVLVVALWSMRAESVEGGDHHLSAHPHHRHHNHNHNHNPHHHNNQDRLVLSRDFYKKSCPLLEDIVRHEFRVLALIDPTTSPSILRLVFHDCQVQGCDASILLDDDQNGHPSELSSEKNFAIRKRDVISLIKSTVEAACPGQVSCADILVMAAREAVAFAGGPRIEVPLGRKDSSTPPNYKAADASLPPSDLGVDGTLKMFAKKGMSVEESVAIMGSHTLGITHCKNLQSRLYESDQDNEMAPGFQASLRLSCPLGSLGSKIFFVQNDPTAFLFDNIYYLNSLSGRGVLQIDSELASDPRTASYVRGFLEDQDRFYEVFSSAFVKMVTADVLIGENGEIRERCDVLNSKES